MRMRHITLLSVVSLAVQCFSTYLINGTILERYKKALNIKCFNFLYKICLKHFFTLRRTERDIIIKVPSM